MELGVVLVVVGIILALLGFGLIGLILVASGAALMIFAAVPPR